MKTLYVYVENDDLKLKYREYIETRGEDSGFDLMNPEKIHLDKTTKVDFNVKCAMMDENNNSLPFYLYMRSSLSKTNIRLANSVGIIDKGYRGYICAYFDVLKSDVLELYQRPVQLCANDLEFFNVVLVDNFDPFKNTLRGDNGFGSTGI
jgi:dUTP pyrophosphatase